MGIAYIIAEMFAGRMVLQQALASPLLADNPALGLVNMVQHVVQLLDPRSPWLVRIRGVRSGGGWAGLCPGRAPGEQRAHERQR